MSCRRPGRRWATLLGQRVGSAGAGRDHSGTAKLYQRLTAPWWASSTSFSPDAPIPSGRPVGGCAGVAAVRHSLQLVLPMSMLGILAGCCCPDGMRDHDEAWLGPSPRSRSSSSSAVEEIARTNTRTRCEVPAVRLRVHACDCRATCADAAHMKPPTISGDHFEGVRFKAAPRTPSTKAPSTIFLHNGRADSLLGFGLSLIFLPFFLSGVFQPDSRPRGRRTAKIVSGLVPCRQGTLVRA